MFMEKIFMYIYEIGGWFDGKAEVCRGVIAATSIPNAVERLMDFYGKDSVDMVKVDEYNCSPIEFSESDVQEGADKVLISLMESNVF